ncbi:hypothetical protein GE09DRAFT_1095234 [Coniochaeta sp. 2T2.1]|nr:hypothetical protein GE09DRAFT_1095234 [Coniochaeta sp. 2T2.1]
MKPSRLTLLLLPSSFTTATRFVGRVPSFTPIPLPRRDNSTLFVEKRIVTELSTCGFLNGDPTNPRTANPGFNCRIDTSHGIWGFCPTTVISAIDCGLGGACIDLHSCSDGCGITNNPSITTWSCTDNKEPFCSTALLTFGVDQTYAFLPCGGKPTTDHYLISPTAAAAVSSSSSPARRSSQTPAPTTSSPRISTTSSSTPSSSSSAPTSSSTSTTGTAASASTASSPANPSSATTNTGTSTTSLGPIIGGVIGGLVVICASAVLAIYLIKRDRSRKRMSTMPKPNTASVSPPEYSPKDPNNTTRYSGWGPRELPAGDPVERARSPVELPGYAM